MDQSADLITTGCAAALLGCSRQHVVDLCTQRALPFVSVGSHRRVRRADVTALARPALSRDQERSLWLHRVAAGG
jgi:excisionase family DNA binding protein